MKPAACRAQKKKKKAHVGKKEKGFKARDGETTHGIRRRGRRKKRKHRTKNNQSNIALCPIREKKNYLKKK